MDDFNISTLHESRNEWSARLISILTPLIIDGYKSILNEAISLCKENNEMSKYLMTFQNLISRVPKWNQLIIENERKRICEKSGCAYLEDLVTCVHIIQLKILTVMRVGQKQKKIDINIPKLDDFIHKVYINVARKLYKNVYLFEINIAPLQMQKNNREIEIIIQESILNTLRESIPVEAILKAYMDETVEEDVTEEIKEQIIEEPLPLKEESLPVKEEPISEKENPSTKREIESGIVKFNDTDYMRDLDNNNITPVSAPKTIERLDEISSMRYEKRKLEEDSEDESDDGGIKILDQDVELEFDSFNEPSSNNNDDSLPDLLDDIEVLY